MTVTMHSLAGQPFAKRGSVRYKSCAPTTHWTVRANQITPFKMDYITVKSITNGLTCAQIPMQTLL